MAKTNPKLYLISPPIIEDLGLFLSNLELALITKKVSVFQLRLKDIDPKALKDQAIKILNLCHKYQVPFILNDNLQIALEIEADGVHLGDSDGDIKEARKKAPQNFIIGASCYDSKHRIMQAAQDGADYVSLGAFFPTKTKKAKGKPTLELLKWCSDFINVPTVCIGGINDKNYQILAENGADFIAVISYIWDHEDGIKKAINSISNSPCAKSNF